MNPIELVHQCREGKRKAQYELFRMYATPMYHVARRIVADPMESEEVVQEAFVKVFEKIHSFEGRATLGAWIKRIVVNQALNEVRKRKMVFDNVEDAQIADLPIEEDDYEDVTADMINEEINLLPEGCRIVVSLHLLEEYKHTEIAEMLSISESTSRSQYMRGRKMLAARLSERMKHEL
ncbi:MAG: sigma-70 family RNA polymerase sigma factor [Flavobacteriales bacterium]|nr:sigma-70 family RNA polymerase sigma factor [Flavobacteriales bacterium]